MLKTLTSKNDSAIYITNSIEQINIFGNVDSYYKQYPLSSDLKGTAMCVFYFSSDVKHSIAFR
jgi:hypothetical protein